MRTIEQISDMIDEEIYDATKYARCAIQHEEDAELAKTFRTLANEELGHATRLHEQVVRLIKKYKDEHGEPPQRMMERYEFIHDKQMMRYADVKVLLS